MTENMKPLSEAQIEYLGALNQTMKRAEVELKRFIAYLRAEHGAPEGEWQITDARVGFVKTPRPDEIVKKRRQRNKGDNDGN